MGWWRVWDKGGVVYCGVYFGFGRLISKDVGAWRFRVYKLGCNRLVAMWDEYMSC